MKEMEEETVIMDSMQLQRLVVDTEDQIAEVEAAFAESDIKLVSKRRDSRADGTPVCRWDIEADGAGSIATIGCGDLQIKGEYRAACWVNPHVTINYDKPRDTDYTSRNHKQNAKKALKRVQVIARRVREEKEVATRRRAAEDERGRLTREELGDVSDVADYVYKPFKYGDERRPIESLRRNDDGTYKVVMRAQKLTMDQVQALISMLRGAK